MVEYSYPECTTAVLTSLSIFRRHFPSHRTAEIDSVISRAIGYILASQQPDGGWYGSWAICFTYATFFALESLATVEQTYQTSIHARRACDWLASKRKPDGGWGEHCSSCELQQYVQHEKSQVVNTAWAVLALMSARYPHRMIVERGLEVSQSPKNRFLPPLH
jgi:lanosterol synthase